MFRNPQCLLRPLLAVSALILAASAWAAESLPPRGFSTPEEAAKVLVDAARVGDAAGLAAIFGSAGSDIVSSGDPVEDENDRKTFVDLAGGKLRIERVGEDQAVLFLGPDDWPFPIPLVRSSDTWGFDVEKGREELLDRRIGRNELNVLKVMEAYLQAQAEYASQDRDGDQVAEYAQKIRSEPGQFDGLFWETAVNEPASPLGPLVADARAEGYRAKNAEQPRPYHGYYYRILTRQGGQAPGGKYSYIINGNMIAGFALLAFPAEYGSSGIMSFIVNQQGNIYQKDLGSKTKQIAATLNEYNPDSSWTLVHQGESL